MAHELSEPKMASMAKRWHLYLTDCHGFLCQKFAQSPFESTLVFCFVLSPCFVFGWLVGFCCFFVCVCFVLNNCTAAHPLHHSVWRNISFIILILNQTFIGFIPSTLCADRSFHITVLHTSYDFIYSSEKFWGWWILVSLFASSTAVYLYLWSFLMPFLYLFQLCYNTSSYSERKEWRNEELYSVFKMRS